MFYMYCPLEIFIFNVEIIYYLLEFKIRDNVLQIVTCPCLPRTSMNYLINRIWKIIDCLIDPKHQMGSKHCFQCYDLAYT